MDSAHPDTGTPDSTADLNNDGVVNILDLVLVASHFGTTNAAADLNADGTVNMDDLVFVANAWGMVAGAPTAGTVNTWLQLARQNVSDIVATPTPEGGLLRPRDTDAGAASTCFGA